MLPDYLNSFPGQLVSWVVDEIRKGGDLASTAWDGQTDDQRIERLDTMATRAEEFAQRLVEIVAAEGNQAVKGTLVSVEFKQGVKVVITCAKTAEHVGDLAMMSGAAIQLLLPQLALDLDGGDAAQTSLDLGGTPGWTPPGEDETDALECTCEKLDGVEIDEFDPECPVHGEEAEPPDATDDDDDPEPPTPPDGDLEHKPRNPADPDDPESENVG